MGRDEQILAAAEALIFEHGFDGVGVDAIGARAGVSGSAIYRHFKSKNEILLALFDHAIDTLLMRLQSPSAQPQDDLAHLVDLHVAFASANPALATIWTREQRSLTDAHRRSYERRQRRYLDRWLDTLQRCFPGNPPEKLVSAIRAVHWMMISDALGPTEGRRADDVHALLTDMAMRSLSALMTGAPERRPSTEN